MNLNLKCLQAICCKADIGSKHFGRGEQPNIVHIEHFGDLVQWFGPIAIPKDPEFDMTILDNIRFVMQYPWFFGDVDTERAQEKLSGRPGGTFLVRFSSQQPGWFTISTITAARTIVHQRIRHSPGGKYKIEDQEYDTLPELIEGRKSASGLTFPCGGSRFCIYFQIVSTK